nr:MAG TPA: hypothetical protein [Caudoviricetes sp.]
MESPPLFSKAYHRKRQKSIKKFSNATKKS